jgi:hypothetical protein
VEDAWGERVVELEGHVLRVEDPEHVDQVPGVEAHQDRFAIRGVEGDLLVGFAELRALAGDLEDPVCGLELDRVHLVLGEERDPPQSLQEPGPAEAQAPGLVLGDHLLVLGKLSVHELHEEGEAGSPEHAHVASEAELRLACLPFREELAQLEDALAWEDHPSAHLELPLDLPLHHGEAVAVGGNQAKALLHRLKEDAVEVEAGLVGGDGDGGELHHVEDLLGVDRGEGDVGDGELREVVCVGCDDAEAGAPAGDLQEAVRLLSEDHHGLRQHLDDLEEPAGAHRHPTLFQDLCAVLTEQANLHVEGGDEELAVPGIQENAREDRDRGLLLRDPLCAVERPAQLLDGNL